MNLREIDRLIAEKVMGEIALENGFDPPSYSVDIGLAWRVTEKMKLGIEPSYLPGRWFSWVPGRKLEGAVADTAPLAICLAALKAVGAEPPA